MSTLLQPLRDEHAELLPRIEQLRTAADAVGTVPTHDLQRRVDEAFGFLTRQLIPHATAEDKALYPVVATVLGDARATDTMRRDHVEVDRLTHDLGVLRHRLTAGEPSPQTIADLRRVLYGLDTLVRVHFAKEEEVYVPLLEEALDEDDATAMFAAMHAAAEEAGAHHEH